jgi:hypothetical protein
VSACHINCSRWSYFLGNLTEWTMHAVCTVRGSFLHDVFQPQAAMPPPFARSLAAHLTISGSMTRTPQFQELCLATALSSIGRCGS